MLRTRRGTGRQEHDSLSRNLTQPGKPCILRSDLPFLMQSAYALCYDVLSRGEEGYRARGDGKVACEGEFTWRNVASGRNTNACTE